MKQINFLLILLLTQQKTTPTIKNKIYIKRAAYQFLSTAAP